MKLASISASAAGLLSGLASAAVTVPTCNNGARTYNVGFEVLPVGSAPPTPFMNVTWTGFTVQDQTSYGSPSSKIIPHSRPNVLVPTNGYYSSMRVSSPDSPYFVLESFYLGCSTYEYPVDTQFPSPCNVTVTAHGTFTPNFPISTFEASFAGKYNQMAGDNNPDDITANMTKVTLPQGFDGDTFTFALSSGQSAAVVTMDNFVYQIGCQN